ncbi:MAG TPA: FliM/FliN family flagellar motor C-terminal domain-containing protein, partial [Oligoflexia bacterium]|nr:FliM/FliN family flagellar motor C-terminal domain-containing protein [Oligoflexia bacterium]
FDTVPAQDAGGVESASMRLAASSAPGKSVLSQFRLQVGIEIGTVELSLDELIDLAAGQVFHLHYDPQRPLPMMVGEERIGECRLVEDGAALMVQVEKIYEPQATLQE